jgi:hypothetical protein
MKISFLYTIMVGFDRNEGETEQKQQNWVSGQQFQLFDDENSKYLKETANNLILA